MQYAVYFITLNHLFLILLHTFCIYGFQFPLAFNSSPVIPPAMKPTVPASHPSLDSYFYLRNDEKLVPRVSSSPAQVKHLAQLLLAHIRVGSVEEMHAAVDSSRKTLPGLCRIHLNNRRLVSYLGDTQVDWLAKYKMAYFIY